ncbi:MAG: hypothetical protein AB8B87_24965 [Granulosicoccus sp.]
MQIIVRLVKWVLLPAAGLIAYFIFSITIGDTFGLEKNLENLDGVLLVENYKRYEGLAFVTLHISENGKINLGSVGNKDIAKSDGLMIYQIGQHEIVCRYPNGRSFSPGIYSEYLGNNDAAKKAVENIPAMIKYYDDLEELFAKMPIEFPIEKGSSEAILCK